MRAYLWTLCLLASLQSVKAAPTALVLVDATIYTNLVGIVTEWVDQVNSEGNYVVDLRIVPRALRTSPDRLKHLEAHRDLIHEVQPAMVQIFGAVAVGISGWQALDGHESRCVHTDAAYMCDRSVVFTDQLTHGTHLGTPGWSNVPNDGRWDSNHGTQFKRPVVRLDFADIPKSGGPTQLIPSGCKKGQPFAPALNELAELRSYFKRNMDFRRGAAHYNNVAYMHGGLWDLANGRVFAKLSMPQFQWVEDRSVSAENIAGRQAYLIWSGYGGEERYLYYDTNCAFADAVWVNVYRSFAMEMYDFGAPMRRWLSHCLVTTWGTNVWHIPPNARTVADAVRASLGRGFSWNLVYNACGDGTLPVNNFRLSPNAPHGLRQ